MLVHGLDILDRVDLRKWNDIEVLMISSEKNICVLYPRQGFGMLVITTNEQDLALLHLELVIIITSMQHYGLVSGS